MIRGDSLRRMYAGGRPNRWARFLNRISAMVFSLGIVGHGAVSLETVNPKSHTLLTLPLVVARYEGCEYVVSMLGQGSRWVRNVRAANGRAVIHAERRRPVLTRRGSRGCQRTNYQVIPGASTRRPTAYSGRSVGAGLGIRKHSS